MADSLFGTMIGPDGNILPREPGYTPSPARTSSARRRTGGKGYTVDIPVAAIMAAVEEWKDDAVEAIADELLQKTKELAAQRYVDRTGNLSASIEKRESDYGGVEVGAYAPHSHLVEFGHAMLNKFGEPTKREHVPGKHFLGDAEKAVAQNTANIIMTRVGAMRIEVKGGKR